MISTAAEDVAVTSLACSCGWRAAPLEPRPFRCGAARCDSAADHVVQRRLRIDGTLRESFESDERDPFLRFRRLTHAWNTAAAIGITDAEYVALVSRLEERIAAVDGRGFSITPFARQDAIVKAIGHHGSLWVKDETGNVSGSHKGRHLMGLMIWLEVASRIDPSLASAPLAIASCGNAALAAAVIARAAGRSLEVFIPPDASASVVERLRDLGAKLTLCLRVEGVAGDPCYRAFVRAVEAGALPFTCQGNENGLVIEGAHTLGWELASQLASEGARLDRLFIQVGGGALASACIAGLEEAHALGVIERMPRIHAVQTASAHPLCRAWHRIVRSGASIDYAIRHRAEFMWPWETPPSSVAHGILDDETYDWVAVVRGMRRTSGAPVIVSEKQLLEAARLGKQAAPVDETGAAGLAGVLELHRRAALVEGESLGVLFTGRERE